MPLQAWSHRARSRRTIPGSRRRVMRGGYDEMACVRASSLWAWSVAIAAFGSVSVGLGPSSYNPAAIALSDAAAAEESHGEDDWPASAPTVTALERAALSARGCATMCPSGAHNAWIRAWSERERREACIIPSHRAPESQGLRDVLRARQLPETPASRAIQAALRESRPRHLAIQP